MAWLRRPRTLNDLIDFQGNLRVTCLDCRHWSDFDGPEIVAYFRAKRWAMAWELVHEHFRCSRCRGKRLRCDPAPPQDPPPAPLALRPRPSAVKEGESPPDLRIVGGGRGRTS
jgi:hypothetical protein